MKVNLKSISASPWNTRGAIDESSVKDLAESIKSQGLINPITIWMNGDGEWFCIAGNRRLAALLSIGATEAECTEFKGTEHEAKIVTVVENLQREDVGILDEAALVEKLLEDGMTAEKISAKTGRSVWWVNRRRRLIALDDAWKQRIADIDADALEKISSYPPDVQRRVAKITYTGRTWRDLERFFNSESRDLDSAKFDTEVCATCMKRTGAEADLFNVVDGCLGKCQDCKCFTRKLSEWKESIINETVGDNEFVIVKYTWQMPEDAKPNRDNKHPCAYVLDDSDGSIEIKWGESKAAKEEAERADAEARASADAEARAKSERIDSIINRMSEVTDNCDEVSEIVMRAVNAGDENAVGYAISSAADSVCCWHSRREWAEILRTFPEIGEKAELTDDDIAFLDGEYPTEEDEADEY